MGTGPETMTRSDDRGGTDWKRPLARLIQQWILAQSREWRPGDGARTFDEPPNDDPPGNVAPEPQTWERLEAVRFTHEGNACTVACGNFNELTFLRIQRERLLARIQRHG